MRFAIVSPAWGARCVDLFTGPVLDSHAAALEHFVGAVRYVCHTDEPERVRAAVTRKTRCDVFCPGLPPGSGYEVFGRATDEALRWAEPGEVVCFLNADIVVSRETFSAVSRLVGSGKKAVMCAGTRTLPATEIPVGAISRHLLAWSIENAHPVIRESFYGEGRTALPSTIYFRDAGGVSMRGFHLHPLAVVKGRDIAHDSTVDWNLVAGFPREEIHIVTDRDELALAEISPESKTFGILRHPFGAPDIVEWAARRTIPFHWWLFEHHITLGGTGATNDGPLVEELKALWADVELRPVEMRPTLAERKRGLGNALAPVERRRAAGC